MCGENGGLGCNERRKKGGPWLEILNISRTMEEKCIPFASSFRRKLGNVNFIKLWTDIWIGNSKLSDKFPRLFALELSKFYSVSDRISFLINIWCRAGTGEETYGAVKRGN